MATACYGVTVVMRQKETHVKRNPAVFRAKSGEGSAAMIKLHRKAAFYLRTATRGKSMENQRLEMEKFCARQDWEIEAVYEDDGYSGITMDRPGLRGMLHDASRGQFSVIVVWDVSRLTRSITDLLAILDDLRGR